MGRFVRFFRFHLSWRRGVAYRAGMFFPSGSKRLTARVLAVLVFSWHVFPCVSSAYENSPQKISLIIQEQKDGNSDNISADSAEALRVVMPRMAPVQIVNPQTVEQILTYYKKSSAGVSSEKENAIENLALAKEHYFSFRYNEAVAEIKSAISAFESGPISENGALLHDALLTYGVIAKADGKLDITKEVFSKAININPFYEIDRVNFPPSIVKIYENLQSDYVVREKGSIRVETDPVAAEVYINGILHGVTPFNLQNVPSGTYTVFIKTNKYRPVEKIVSVGAKEQVVINERLRWIEDPATKTKKEEAAIATQAELAEGVRMAELLRADKAILINCNETGGKNTLVARMVDRKYRAAYRPVVYEYAAVEERATAIAEVAEVLALQASVNLLDDPMKYLDPNGLGDPILLGARKRKIYRSPIFWTVIGLAAAGAIAGGILAATSSGSSGDTGSVEVQFR